MTQPPLGGASLEPDEPEYDILYSERVAKGMYSFTDGPATTIDFEVRPPDGSETYWIRVTPVFYRQNDDHPNLWHIDVGTYRRLQDNVEVGLMADVSGWFSTIRNPGAIAGKLSL